MPKHPRRPFRDRRRGFALLAGPGTGPVNGTRSQSRVALQVALVDSVTSSVVLHARIRRAERSHVSHQRPKPESLEPTEPLATGAKGGSFLTASSLIGELTSRGFVLETGNGSLIADHPSVFFAPLLRSPALWKNPRGNRPTEPQGPPQEHGERLATFARGRDQELRVSLAEFEGHPYVALRVWQIAPDITGTWWPVKGKGCSIRMAEASQLAEVLARVAGAPQNGCGESADDLNHRSPGRATRPFLGPPTARAGDPSQSRPTPTIDEPDRYGEKGVRQDPDGGNRSKRYPLETPPGASTSSGPSRTTISLICV